MEEHEKGINEFEDQDAYRLHCLRHSTAHVMAQAITRLYPEVKLAIGPPIKDGFYYDIELEHTISEAELTEIEKAMKRVVKENQRFVHEEWDVEQARTWFGEQSQDFKLELIDSFDDPTVHIYRNDFKDGSGAFIDLCRGPHVMRTGQCKHFRLTKVSGAYWRGDATKPQLQRIYGTVWRTRADLDAYLFRVEEAKKRDHRKLGRELDLFMFHEYAPGAVFWLPKGEDLYNILSVRMRRLLLGDGYVAVRTPLIFDKGLWETSGHWEHYQEDMFHFPESWDEHHAACADENGNADGVRKLGLKPMNCPSHMLVFRSRKRSYKELPLRIHDQGVLHRNELSGTLSGLTRVRQFCQDDAHIFCMPEQIGGEVAQLMELVHKVYGAFGMGYRVKLSTRPEKYLGDIEVWNAAEAALKEGLDASGVEYTTSEGDGAFYGPKIDFDVLDALEREFQCATIQLDFQLPERFELTYVGADNAPHRPVVIHRAILGSFERFIGILIEHYAGAFPVWLAPEQVRIMNVSERSEAYGESVVSSLRDAGVKVTYDASANKIGYKIREWHSKKVPYAGIIGMQEQEDGTVSIRSRDGGDLGAMSVDDFVARVVSEAEPRF